MLRKEFRWSRLISLSLRYFKKSYRVNLLQHQNIYSHGLQVLLCPPYPTSEIFAAYPDLQVQVFDFPNVFFLAMPYCRVSVQGVKSLGDHFACLCQGFEFYKEKINFVIIFQKENGNTFTLLIIFTVKSLQKEQNSTNLLL